MEILFKEIADNVIAGKADKVKTLVDEGLKKGISAKDLLDKALIAGMDVVGSKFKNNEFYIPEVLIAARAMKSGMTLLEPLLSQGEKSSKGKIIIGTVEGDLHDIGKNLVTLMLKGAGYDVIDLGIDVPSKKFAEACIENKVDIIAMSALLTTTMVKMKDVITELKKVNFSGKTMVGGAPLTQDFANEIGANLYASDAATAVDVVKATLIK